MDLMQALYNAYNYAQRHNMVDCHDKGAVILPLFHSSLRSTGENLVEIILTNKGEFLEADFCEKDIWTIFPVTYDSVGRSGTAAAPHPLVDKASYLVPSSLNSYKAYRNEFLGWKEWVKEEQVFRFLDLIDQFTQKEDWFDQVLSELFPEFDRDGLAVKAVIDGKEKKYNFKDIYLTFKILDFQDGEDFDVNAYTELHESYVEYVKSKLEFDGICNISGLEDQIAGKHRGLMGNSRLISISHPEAYKGRFRKGEDVFKLGYLTSEKAHIMLRYLMENPNSNQFLGDTQYLVNWFSDDITNETRLDITEPNEISVTDERIRQIVTRQNKEIGSSFIKGEIRFHDQARYYLLLIDKSSPGRVSAKYFKALPVSELVQKLKVWNDRYQWPTYVEERGEIIDKVSSFYNIMVCTYGVERDKKLVVDNKKFQKDQIQKMITAMMEGQPLPENISKNLAQNIRMRLRYKDTWAQVKRLALTVLRNNREKRYDDMLEKENRNRSYLYGRLLAVYEQIEKATYMQGKGESERLTNAEKFWTAFLNNPARTQITLERNVQVYLNKLMKTTDSSEGENDNSKRGLAIRFKKAKSEIIEALSELYKEDPKALSKPLEFDFIFGYEAQKKELFRSLKDQKETKNIQE